MHFYVSDGVKWGGKERIVFDVKFYETETGEKPVEDFILSTDKKMQAKIYRGIDLLKANGNEVREPQSAFVEDGIFELRTKVSTNISRILYFFVFGGKIILTNGFIKKTQKTPRNEIELAKKRRSDYLLRFGGGK